MRGLGTTSEEEEETSGASTPSSPNFTVSITRRSSAGSGPTRRTAPAWLSFPDPTGHKSIAGDLALIGHYDRLLTDLELSIVQTAQEEEAQTFYRLRSIPGAGKILALGRLYESHALQRSARAQAFVASCRLVKGAKASAGKRDGTAGQKIGKADLTWVFSEAAGLF